MALTGKNITLPIYYDVNQTRTPFHNLVLHKFTVDSVVMSLGDKITGDVYYIDKNLVCSMKEYVVFNDVEYTLISPPTLVKEGMVSDNSDLKGMCKYSFEFYHPMYMLGNLPFTDVAVSYDELRYKSQDKTFSWIGKPADFVAKLNKNLEGTEWVVVMSDRFPQEKEDELSEVLSFDDNTIADVLKTGYETWGVPYVVDKLHQGEYYHTDANNNNVDYYTQGKRFVVVFGLPSNEIYASAADEQLLHPFVFKYGQGVGLKNHSRTPRNNKIVTRIAGYGSERNIPYGYPQIRWYGDQTATCTIGDSVGAKENVTINGVHYDWAMSYPIYDGIVGGQWVKLIKHPFTRKHLMPSVYADDVFNKVSQFTLDRYGNVIPNTNYDPDIEIKDYYDAIDGYDYVNLINPVAPSYEIHEFDDIYPELGSYQILGATPINADLTDADGWDDTMDDDGNYLQSFFKMTLPQLTFDIYACAAITEEMEINMRSGACIGCTFTVQVDWEDYKRNFYDSDMNFAPNGSQRDLTRYPDSSQGSITVVVQKDINTFGTIMPNIYQYPQSGDDFVVLGISLPLSYITSAQERLDDAMKSYMLENNIHYYDYPLKFDEYFLANHTNILNQIRPNSIIRFEFNNEDLELFVKQLTIKFNENKLPQYDITLTDNIEVVLNQIGKVADDVERLGTLIALLRQNYNKNVWAELAKKLSKVNDDTALGLISFAQGWETAGFFSNNFIGYGAKVNQRGVGEFEELNVRGALRASELVFNQISSEEGESIRSIGHGEIETVTIDTTNTNKGTATLKLDGDEWATIDVGDICRGLYNTIGNDDLYEASEYEDEQDANGFRTKIGFFSSYFRILNVTSTKGQCTFTYSLQVEGKSAISVVNANDTAITQHPCPLMKFAVYGNVSSSKSERQSSIYTTAVGIAPRELYLAGVNNWRIKPENIKIAKGNIEGVKAWEIVSESEYDDDSSGNWKTETRDGETIYMHLKTLHGDAGFYCEDNIYLGGIIDQFKSAAMDVITAEASNLGQAYVWTDVSSFIVDCDSNGTLLDYYDIEFFAKLYFGSHLCTLTEAKFNNYEPTDFLDNDTKAFYSEGLSASDNPNFQSYVIQISLKGTYNGTEYSATKSVNVFANRQGTPGGQGNSGDGAAWIEALPNTITVDCYPNGIVAVPAQATITASLYVGNSAVQTLTTKTLQFINGGNFNVTIPTPNVVGGVVSWNNVAIADQIRVLPTNSALKITLSNGTYTATKTIPVIPVKRGEQGDRTGGYSAQLTHASDNIVIDNAKNVVGGLENRLFTKVNIWDADNGEQLEFQRTGTLADGKYKLIVTENNCTTSIADNGTIQITDISNYSLNQCSVEITATTYDNVEFQFVYTVTFIHIDQSYLTFDLDNEYDSMAYRTQTKRYDGLPIESTINVYANDVQRDGDEVTYGNVRILGTESVGYIKKVSVTSDLFSGTVQATPSLLADNNGNVTDVTHRDSNTITISSNGDDTGLRFVANSSGLIRLFHNAQNNGAEIDLADAKHWFDITCEVVYGGVTYVSPTKRLTVVEETDSTIYRLMLSATAISQEETTYTPSSIEVKVSITDDNGTAVYTPNASTGLVTGNVYVKYINGTYNTSGTNTLLDTCPVFSQVQKVFTVVLVDRTNSDNPTYLDIQTVTISKGGKDGAGQSWIRSSHDQFVVDCNSSGNVISTKTLNIEAWLRWGDEECTLIGGGESTIVAANDLQYSSMTETSISGTKVSKSFTFRQGLALSSSYITITLAGKVNGIGDKHTAQKTISVIANKQGEQGDSVTGEAGRGIVSVVTYYKRASQHEGVTPPNTDVTMPADGWVASYIEPTASEPYLWRFTRTTYTKATFVEQTDAELIKVYSEVSNYNLLDDTSFGSLESMDAWTEKGELHSYGSSVPVQHDVTAMNGIYTVTFRGEQSTSGENGYIKYLLQPITDKLVANTWYTLSFYLYGTTMSNGASTSKTFQLDLDMTGLFDTSVHRFIDGTEKTSADVAVHFIPTTEWTRHTVTFKTPSELGNNLSINFSMYTMRVTEYIQMKQPKLEVGMVATGYVDGNLSIGLPMARVRTWQTGVDYYKGASGERWLDMVAYNNRWYQCAKSHISNNSNKPNEANDTTYWKRANNFSFIATDLLLADQAVINLMFSQKILMTNAANQLTASINADGNGSYCIYYPETGCKMFEFSSTKDIVCYNNDEDNSVAWKLGQSGKLQIPSSPSWSSISLSQRTINNAPANNSFHGSDVFTMIDYPLYHSGQTGGTPSEDGKVFDANQILNLTATGLNYIPDGWYTRNTHPMMQLQRDDSEVWVIEVSHYVSGVVVEWKEITTNLS